MYGKTARLAVVLLSLAASTATAQDKEKTPPKTEPKKPPVITVAPATAPAMMLQPPIKIDSVKFRFQDRSANGGTRASPDGRYVAINHPFLVIEFINPSNTTTILRGMVLGTLYRGTPAASTVSVRPAGPSPTVPQMFADMQRWAFDQYTARKAMIGTLRPGELTTDGGRFHNPLDSLTSYEYNDATWTPKETIIVEVNVPYTLRADIAHEIDGMTRYYRADLTFRFDASGRARGGVLTFPPPPPSTPSRPSVEVRR